MPCLEQNMKIIAAIKSGSDGFSLIEMAIVLFIIALLLGGLLPTISGQIEQKNRNETRKQLDEIQQALFGFALTNGRLPCPADPTTPSGQSNVALVPAGMEYRNPGAPNACVNVVGNSAWGVLPWATLGVNETDGWGRRFTYRVTSSFADTTDGTGCAGTVAVGTSFQLCSSGSLTVQSSFGGNIIAPNLPVIIISHGTNGLGAYSSLGQKITPIPGAGTDEGENTDNNDNFVSHEIRPDFDDQVVWISPNILINRMVTAGKLP